MSLTIWYLHRCSKTHDPLCWEQYNIYTDTWKQKTICVTLVTSDVTHSTHSIESQNWGRSPILLLLRGRINPLLCHNYKCYEGHNHMNLRSFILSKPTNSMVCLFSDITMANTIRKKLVLDISLMILSNKSLQMSIRDWLC